MTKKDRMGMGDTLRVSLTVPDTEDISLGQLEEESMAATSYDGLRVEKFRDGWAVFTDDVEAPVTVRNQSVFDSEEDAQEALEFYAEART